MKSFVQITIFVVFLLAFSACSLPQATQPEAPTTPTPSPEATAEVSSAEAGDLEAALLWQGDPLPDDG